MHGCVGVGLAIDPIDILVGVGMIYSSILLRCSREWISRIFSSKIGSYGHPHSYFLIKK